MRASTFLRWYRRNAYKTALQKVPNKGIRAASNDEEINKYDENVAIKIVMTSQNHSMALNTFKLFIPKDLLCL